MEVSPADSATLTLGFAIEEDKLFEGAGKVLDAIRPGWPKDRVNYKLFTDGITNKLVGCFCQDHPEDGVLVRVYGEKTDLLIDRTAETRNIKMLHRAGHAPRLWATFANGLAYGYVAGEVLTAETCRDPGVFPLVARSLARVHRLDCGPAEPRRPCLWGQVRRFLDLAPVRFPDPRRQARFEETIPSSAVLEREFALLQSKLSSIGSPVVFCHNDLLLGNIIHNPKEQKVTFIDYEYASYNYQAYDIANHFAEFAGVSEVDYSRYPSREFQARWLRVYLEELEGGRPVPEAAVDRLCSQVDQFCLAAHFFWGAWSLIQAEHSTIDFDFLGYAAIRFKEYFARKDKLNDSET
ncbi:ethanolamine kinase 1 [Bacillus rossius redtenbacheri]|uniref:ethanolamine kinase 1 n=1 Tax=Bacillus rossius redtenbacheri TaxID=93214 RepID=UPI002FDD51C4